MNESTTEIGRPRIGEMLETQLDFFAPAVQVRRQTRGRALGRFVTLVMLLILAVVLAGHTVVAAPFDQRGAGNLLIHQDSETVLPLPIAIDAYLPPGRPGEVR